MIVVCVFCLLNPYDLDFTPLTGILAVLLAAMVLWTIWGALRSCEPDERGIHIYHDP